jgi:CheY-like chemotaxis protein
MAMPVTLFYSYSHKDEEYCNELRGHLMILERRGIIRSWNDRAILPGHDWAQEIDNQLRTADLVLLLISVDFIRSDYITSVELKLAMDRHQANETVVVPIMIRPVDLQKDDEVFFPFLKQQGLPKDLKPVITWSIRDEAWTDVAKGIRRIVDDLLQSRTLRAPVAPSPAQDTKEDLVTKSHQNILEHVVGNFAGLVAQANRAKGGPPLDTTVAREQALQLIDLPNSERVLWVDDIPDNNRNEIRALAHLQVDVVCVRSTNEALKQLADAKDEKTPFTLVISDWSRDSEAANAGLRLLREMRKRQHAQPVIFYHGAFGVKERAARAKMAREAGAFGEAILPEPLIQMVLNAMRAERR